MGSEPSETEPSIPRPEIEDPLTTHLNNDEGLIHISGQPGVGKSTVISYIKKIYGDSHEIAVSTIGEHQTIQDLYREIYSAIFDRLPEEAKEGDRKLSGGTASAFGFGAGLSFESNSPEAPFLQTGPRDVLNKTSTLFPDEQRLIICLDDVHNLSGEQATRDAIKEAAGYLDSNVMLVTAGQLTFNELPTSITVSMFSEAQTVELLRESFPEITENRARQVHEQLSGHPLYVGLFIGSDDTRAIPDIPQAEIYAEIEKRYLRSLSDDEERFLVATSPLLELDEQCCAAVIAEQYEFDRVDISRTLQSLRERVIVRELGRNEDGFQKYKIHNVFREFLDRRLTDEESNGIHRRSLRYYAEKSLSAAGTENFEQEVSSIVRCLRHISQSAINSSDPDLVDFLSSALDENLYRFYSVSLVADKVKNWQVAKVEDQLTDIVITQLRSQPDMARHFLDEDTDRSWAEELFSRGIFDDPEGPFLSYLRRIVSVHPDFVLEVIQSTDTEKEGARRLLLSISSNLPAGMAASISSLAADWITNADSGRALNHQGRKLVSHLCENGEFDSGLEVLEAILRPKEGGTGDSAEQERAASIYGITEILNETLDDFVSKIGLDFVEVLESNLSIALLGETEGEDSEHDLIAQRRTMDNLNYTTGNQVDLDEVLLEFFVRASEQWMAMAPANPERQNLLDRLLSKPETFRRVGLHLLENHIEEYPGRTTVELTTKENYQDGRDTFEFYRLLQSAFEHLDNEVQQEICELIIHGPYAENVRNRAKYYAQQSDKTSDVIATGIRKRWRRNRLYLVKDYLPNEYQNSLNDFIETYGDPDTLPTKPHRPETREGGVNERGPEETEELADRPASDVLAQCVEWEPPETENWDKNEMGLIDEYNHRGFSSQLNDLIKQNPSQYAEEITILENGDPQYAGAALEAFRDALEDGRAFPWNAIMELCETIIDEPKKWGSVRRTSTVKLLNKGIIANETTFPAEYSEQVRGMLLRLIADPDPSSEYNHSPKEYTDHNNPLLLASSSVRPNALGALISFATWETEKQTEQELNDDIRDAIRDRIVEDSSLAVHSIIGRRLYYLWNLDQSFVKTHLDEIFPRGDDPSQRERFVLTWDQYVRHNNLYAVDALGPYYQYALERLDMKPVGGYHPISRPTAPHIASSYLFGDGDFRESDSLISQFYSMASPDNARDLAVSISSKAQKDEDLNSAWDRVRTLWEWRLDSVSSEGGEYESEFSQYLQCAQHIDTARLPTEKDLIARSFEHVAENHMIWRRTEEWLAEESTVYPEASMQLYQNLVESVSVDEWAETAMNSQEDQRQIIYRNAVSSSDNARQIALAVANRFAAEHYEMDREFLNDHFGSNL